MKVLCIKKSWKYLPMEIINTLVFLAPILFAYLYDPPIFVIIFLIIYILLVISIAVYVIFYLRFNTCIMISDHGIELEKKFFLEWTNIESYCIKEEEVKYYSAETGHGYSITQTLHITLKNADLVRFPVDQLDRKPTQIIALFDQRKFTNNKPV